MVQPWYCCYTNVLYVHNTGVLSKLFFNWAGPLLTRGSEKVLQEEDLWELPERKRMGPVADQFEAGYQIESTIAAAGVCVRACTPIYSYTEGSSCLVDAKVNS